MILGTFGSFLASLTLDQWVKLAPAAIEFVSAAVKLGEQIEPIIVKFNEQIVHNHSRGKPNPENAFAAQMQWHRAWTAIDQRAVDFQSEGRG